MSKPTSSRRPIWAESAFVAGLLLAACQASPPPSSPEAPAGANQPPATPASGPADATTPLAPVEVAPGQHLEGQVLVDGQGATGYRLELRSLRTGQSLPLSAAYRLAHEGEAEAAPLAAPAGQAPTAPPTSGADGHFHLSAPQGVVGEAWMLVATSPEGGKRLSMVLGQSGPAKLRLAQAGGGLQLDEATTALALVLEPALRRLAGLKPEAAAEALAPLLAEVGPQVSKLRAGLKDQAPLRLAIQQGQEAGLKEALGRAQLSGPLAEQLSRGLIAAAKLAEDPTKREAQAVALGLAKVPGLDLSLEGELGQGALRLKAGGQSFEAAKAVAAAIVAIATGSGSTSGGGGGGGGSSSTPSPSPDPTATQSLSLGFKAVVGNEDLTFTMEDPASPGQRIPKVYTGLGSSSASVSPVDFRFYVHGVEVRKADGSTWAEVSLDENAWQYQGTALMDFEDNTGLASPNGTAATHQALTGVGPAGSLTGLRFILGIPERHNHKDVATAPAPLNVSRLFWSWTSGRKHARLDFSSSDRPATSSVFNMHLGATGCAADATATASEGYACTTPNTVRIELTGFDPRQKEVLADYLRLVATTDLKVEGGGAGGCMSGPTDPDCTQVMRSFGLSFGGGTHPSGQQFFRVAP